MKEQQRTSHGALVTDEYIGKLQKRRNSFILAFTDSVLMTKICYSAPVNNVYKMRIEVISTK